MAVQAASARPSFYAAILRIAPDLESAGITREDALRDFLNAIYQVLGSGGAEKPALLPERVKLGAKLLHVLSQTLLVQLTNNGVPRQPMQITIGGT